MVHLRKAGLVLRQGIARTFKVLCYSKEPLLYYSTYNRAYIYFIRTVTKGKRVSKARIH